MSAQKRHAEVMSAPDARNSTLLQAAEAVLRQAHRSLHSREIAQAIVEAGLSQLTGKTPWKTVTARLSMDILDRGSASHFMRTSYGLFAPWNAKKIEIMEELGYPVAVLTVAPSPSIRSGTDIRAAIRAGDPAWRDWVPKGSLSLIEQWVSALSR